MVDFDSAENMSLEAVFSGIVVCLSNFHREQARHRYK